MICILKLRTLIIIAFLAALAGLSPAWASDEVGWPRFTMSNGEQQTAGKAFAINWYRNRKLIITPLHILSPEAGYSHYVRPADVAREVSTLDVMDLLNQAVLASSRQPLLKTGWTVGQGTGDLSGDIMAFELSSSSRLKPFQLCATLPPKGTRVWVLSKEMNTSGYEPDRFAGTVSSGNASGLVVDMDSPLTALSSSGSPVINAKNELVGMMVGKADDTRQVIMAIPSTSILRRLYGEIGQ